MDVKTLEKRIKKLNISMRDEVSYTIGDSSVTTTMSVYLDCLRHGLPVSMYHLKHGRPERCAAAYIKTLTEAVDEELVAESMPEEAAPDIPDTPEIPKEVPEAPAEKSTPEIPEMPPIAQNEPYIYMEFDERESLCDYARIIRGLF
ncbi:MAG: hypothetical protein Q4C52_04815 [Eubacteriales bacterium]|nr:hypothetical protein [Eubacteriales bacterium]